MHRLLVDQNVRIEVAEAVREDGHEVVRPSETGVASDDEALFRWAIDNGFTILTFDVDFAERVYWNPEAHPGVVRLRHAWSTAGTHFRLSYRTTQSL